MACTCIPGYKPDFTKTSCVALNAPIQPKNSGSCSEQQSACTNPINSGAGNKYQRETDYSGTGEYPLRGERSYDSGGATPSVIETTMWGSQWRGFYDRSIAVITIKTYATTAILKREDGKQYYYSLVNGAWVGDADVMGALLRQTNGGGVVTGWTYTNEHDEVETYDANGKLVSITNRAGLIQALTYSDGTAGANGGYVLDAAGIQTATILPAGRLIRVMDPSGRTLQFGYDAAGRTVKMTDPAGGVYSYAYSGTLATDNLTAATYPDGKTRTYLYGETANVSATPNAGVSYAHALTGIIDENGARYASWTYDAAGLAVSSEHGAMGSGIDHVGLAYGTPDASGNSTTSVTDVRGVTRTYTFSTLLGVVKNTGISGQPCNGCSNAFTYDANGNMASRTDFNGNRTCYAYDLTRNLETVRIEGLPSGSACPANLATATITGVARKITTQWHATYRLPALVAEPLRITTYYYDASGNLSSKAIQPTTDTNGGAGASATANGTPRATSYTYNAAGQVRSVNGPRTDTNDTTQYDYDTQGNLISVTNALNQTTDVGGYDANGRPHTITGPNGLFTSLTYDERGRLTSRNVGGETTFYTYDGVGNLTGVALPTGAAYTYTYDAAHRLTQITDAQGNMLTYTLDNAGNRTYEEIRDTNNNIAQKHSRVFDTLNRLYQDIGAVNQVTTYTYDNNGNLKTVTDPLNRLTTNVYDALNRLNKVTNPDNGIIQYAYDGLDQLTQITDPRSLITSYNRDGLNNLNQTNSPDTGATAATYDAAGNVLTKTDAKGQTATYTYDALNRITGITYTGAPAQSVTYQYDQGANGIGHLTGISDATGTASYTYGQHGRLTGETDQEYGAAYTTTYAYDTQGRLTGITYPSGRLVNYTYDTQGRINGIATSYNGQNQALASNIAYRPFGGMQSFAYGNGQTYTRLADQDGRIASYTLNGQIRTIGYDAASQITTIGEPSSPANVANYSYDPMSRLTGFIQGSTGQNFGYDNAGNRTTKTIGSSNTAYTYGATSNWLTAIGSQAVSHDYNGATTADGARQYSYDARGRLIQATTTQGAINYEVNALGLRVRKQVPYGDTDTVYHYDNQGRLIGENPVGDIKFTREYIYLGDVPVAVMQ